MPIRKSRQSKQSSPARANQLVQRTRLIMRGTSLSAKSASLVLTVVIIMGGYFLYSASQAATIWDPVYGTNFPDPTVLNYNGQYYGYSTSSGGINIPTAVSSDTVHWSGGPNALPNLPVWATGNPWAPSVTYDSSSKQFIMFYAIPDTQMSNKRCIGKAVASSPTGPFIDSSSSAFLCQPSLGGSIDAAVFTDSDGSNYLYVKNAGDSSGQADSLWVQPLTATFTPTGTLTQLLSTDQSWQGRTIEGPGMLKLGGKYFLFYAGNNYDSSSYAIGYAVCNSAVGPCTDGPNNPLIASQATMLGPGSPAFFTNNSGQVVMDFAAWYGSVGSERDMYEATITLSGSQPIATAITPSVPTSTPTPTPVQSSPKPTPVPTSDGGGGPPVETPKPSTVVSSGTNSSGNKSSSTGVTTATSDSSVTTKIDGAPASTSGGSVNTAYLTNGTHTISITKDGKTITKTIVVKNKLNAFQTIRDFVFADAVGHPLLMNIGTVILIGLLIGGVIYVALRVKSARG
jgi:hypothetical protein